MNRIISHVNTARNTSTAHRQSRLRCIAGCLILLVLILSACDSDLDTEEVMPTPAEPIDDPDNPVDPGDENDGNTSEALPFSLTVGSTVLDLTEGEAAVTLPISVERQSGSQQTIELTASADTDSELVLGLSDSLLDADESVSQLSVSLPVSTLPIQPRSSQISLVADSGGTQRETAVIEVQITPTSAPDVYLLIGQSNMVGSSEPGARQIDPGEPDEPDERIRQLNVTGNDSANFSRAEDFVDPVKLYNTGLPLTIAIDPLHSGLEAGDRKSGDRVGLGLSFAKAALADTTSTIVLVPAAWSGTGFCNRSNPRVEGLAWNPRAGTGRFNGTLLFDRAVARANAALELSGGVLRGILWHQGESDSDATVCAQNYASNLKALVDSLRTDITSDQRGPLARGTDADIPFIAGTMSRGGGFASFSATKSLVDQAHRGIAEAVPFAGFVNADDLVPPAFPCGDGSCIHFGAAAYREMGRRYYDQLKAVASQ